jgi:N-acetylglucosaminyldiphosphoundecaprenol N-acetyl-beta-D-mannosaminyltransferase
VSGKRVNVLGVGVSVLNLDQARARLREAVQDGAPAYVCVTTVHCVIGAYHDPALRAIYNRSLLTTPDGMPLVWAGRLAGHREMGRVYGPDLMLDTFRWTEETGHSHFLFGGAPGVAETLRSRLAERFPRARIVGTYTPPFRPLDAGEEAALAAQVAAVRPDFFWVGISSPKQDHFMAAQVGRLATRVMIGVGAAFDFHSGRVAQAPRWMQRSGLEWFFRLCADPRRLWRRYVTTNPQFLWLAFCQATGLKRFPLDPPAGS